MTFKEWMENNRPKYVDKRCIAGVYGCPYNYGLEAEEESVKNCDTTKKGFECCEQCWNREMPEKEKSMKKRITKADLKPGERFTFKGFEWIVLDNNVDGGVLAIMSSTWNGEEYGFDKDGDNNYEKSSLRRKLLNELLPILGENNLIIHEVDLVADNGDDRYGTVTDRVFILSCDEYRKYRKNVPLLPEWMWTCTPWYITHSGNGGNARIVSSDGFLYNNGTRDSSGVLPACVFKKDVVVEEVSKDD